MTDKTSLNRAFNNYFFEFLKDVKVHLPDDPEFDDAIGNLQDAKKLNPTILIKSWYTCVYMPYKDVIDSKNVAFFFEKDYNSDLEGVRKADKIIALIDKIREPINKMEPKERDYCATYIKNLSDLSAHYSSM